MVSNCIFTVWVPRVASYRNLFGTVFQDYKLFAASIAENVMLRGELSDEDKEKVKNALNRAGIDDRITALTYGIDSVITKEFDDGGVIFSGGESQKIALARTFAQPFELVIMDEPSSALDPISEYELNQSILKNAENKTIIFISHRLSTTRMADRIYMFADGKVIEYGSHNELMKRNEKYAEMYRVQAKKYRIS